MDSNPLGFLVGDTAAFFKQHWEQQPVVLKASGERQQFAAGLFGYAELQRLALICEQEGEPLEFGVDVNAARYVNGKRETPNGEVADAAAIERLYSKEGCTMQFHQPQRFSEELWRLLAALERQLGCLVGSNAYLTPKGTQGLAPHYDDVEIFVVQTEGTKRWRLYRPGPPAAAAAGAAGVTDGSSPAGSPAGSALLAHCHLANRPSGDLQESEIGEAVMEFTLEVGDVLYMPRGTIHQAVAQTEASSHLTISTYQRWSWADLMQYTVSVVLANPQLQPLLPAPLKAGLPPRFLSTASIAAGDAAALAVASGGFAGAPGFPPPAAAAADGSGADKVALARQLAAACRSMAECLEDEELGPRFLQTAADAMSDDFMRSRLPPHPEQLPARGPAPTLGDSVQCIASGLFRLVPMNTTDEAPEGEGGCGADCEEDHEHVHEPHYHHHHHHEHKHEHGAGCGAECDEEHEHEHGEGGSSWGQPPAWVRLVSCLQNDRDSHMLSGGDGGGKDDGGSSSDDDSGSEMSDAEGEEEEEEEAEAPKEQKRLGAAAAATKAAAAAGAKRKHQQEAGSGSDGEDDSGSEDGSGDSDGDSDEDEEEDEEQEDLVFPAEFAPALVQLLGSAPDAAACGRPVAVAHIALPDPELRMQVAAALWEAGVLRTVKAPPPPQQKPKAAKQQQQQRQKAARQQQKQGQQQPPQEQQLGHGKAGKKAAAKLPAVAIAAAAEDAGAGRQGKGKGPKPKKQKA